MVIKIPTGLEKRVDELRISTEMEKYKNISQK